MARAAQGVRRAAPPLTPPGMPGRDRGAGAEFDLRRRGRAALFLLAVFLPGAWLAALAARVGLAATWGDSLEIATLQRAVALDRGNADLHFNLGTVYLWAEGGNPAAAVEELQQATRLNPNAAAYWPALAQACYAAGQSGCAGQAWERAVQLAPSKPRYRWEAALHYLVSRRPQAAWPHLRRLLQYQPRRAAEVFELLQRSGSDGQEVWGHLVGTADAEVRLRFLSFLVAHAQFPAAARFWNELAATPGELPLSAADDYVEQLLRHGHYGAAAAAWARLRPGTEEGNLAFNGGFEQAPLEAGFDWHFQPQTYLAINFADAGAHSGRHALRLDFTAPANAEYEPAYEFVRVRPGQSYTLSAWVRSASLTSDSGPRLQVVDPQCPACLSLASAGTVGTRAWQQVAVQFTAPPAAQVVRLSLWRPRSRSFPMEISGQFWLDDVAVRPHPVLPAAARDLQP